MFSFGVLGSLIMHLYPPSGHIPAAAILVDDVARQHDFHLGRRWF